MALPLVARLPRVAALDSTGWHSLGAILWGSSAPVAEEKTPHLPACRNSPTGTLWQGLSYIRWRMWGLGLQHGGHIEGWQELCLDVGIRGILEDLRPAFRSFPVVRRSSLLFISHPRNPSATWFTASLHATLHVARLWLVPPTLPSACWSQLFMQMRKASSFPQFSCPPLPFNTRTEPQHLGLFWFSF